MPPRHISAAERAAPRLYALKPEVTDINQRLEGLPPGQVIWSTDRPEGGFGSGEEPTWTHTGNGTTLTTTASASQLNAVDNTQAEINVGLLALDISTITSLNIVAVLASTNAAYTPQLDAVVIGTDAYSMLRPVTDFTVTKKKAFGLQTLTLTRMAAGSANHIYDYI